jgi:hypothetical protein
MPVTAEEADVRAKVVGAIGSALLLAGCLATTDNYLATGNAWIGHTEIEIVQSAWGVPQRVYETGGHRFLVYEWHRTGTLPGSSPNYTSTVIGNQIFTNAYGGTSPTNVTLACTTTFDLVNDVIVDWQGVGNACRM